MVTLTDNASYTVAEAAQLMRCSRSAVYTLIDVGDLRAYRVGSRGLRVYGQVLREFMCGVTS